MENIKSAQFLPNTPDWNSIAAAKLIAKPKLKGQEVVLAFDVGECILELFEDGLRFRSLIQRDVDYGLVVDAAKPTSVELKTTDNATQIWNKTITIEVVHEPFSISIKDQHGDCRFKSSDDGHFVRKHRIPALAKTQHGWLFTQCLKSNEPVYGLGEKWSSLNKRGEIVRSFNHDALGVNAEISYKNAPFGWSPEGWAVFVNTPSAVTHSVGYAQWSQRAYCCLVEDEHLDFRVFVSQADELESNVGAAMLARYTKLTGRAPVPPLWSGGVILSKAYYADSNEIISVAKEVRKRKMPCDVITFDGRAWQDTKTRFAFEWDASRYPDPGAIVDELKAMNFKICMWEYPLISVEHAWFKEFSEKGWLLKDNRTGEAYQYDWDSQAFGDVLTSLPRSGIVDFTHPDAYEFWRDAHKPLFELGVDMIKADFGEQLEDENMIAFNRERGLALHNVYAHLYNRCVYEAAELYSKSGPFLFSRAAWSGSQRFNSCWGGDPQADWEGMMANIRGGLSWGLTGAPFYATDVGGFYKDTRDDALYVRWTQAAIFSAHFRLHGIGPREPWSYSDAANKAVMQALHLRYRLQHYLQSAMHEAAHTGLPVQRPMVLALPKEKQAWSFENQFMFGEDILVAPCYDPEGYVEFYLPHGNWLQFNPQNENPKRTFKGGLVHKIQLQLDEMATFIREGVQIPLNMAVETTNQLAFDEDHKILVNEMWPSSSPSTTSRSS